MEFLGSLLTNWIKAYENEAGRRLFPYVCLYQCPHMCILYIYNQHFMLCITRALEGRKVSVMSCITSIFEAIFSYSKMAVFSHACSTPSIVNYTRCVLMRVVPPLKFFL
jgi:hypothetical protein